MTESPTGGGTTTPEGPGGRIEPIELQTSMQRAYIDYAMAVIVGRAVRGEWCRRRWGSQSRVWFSLVTSIGI